MSHKKKDNKNFGYFKAKKEYECELTGKRIKVGDMYCRINMRYFGIHHFHQSCSKEDIDLYLDYLVAPKDSYNPCYACPDDSEGGHIAMSD